MRAAPEMPPILEHPSQTSDAARCKVALERPGLQPSSKCLRPELLPTLLFVEDLNIEGPVSDDYCKRAGCKSLAKN